jgi:hypothetical protein
MASPSKRSIALCGQQIDSSSVRKQSDSGLALAISKHMSKCRAARSQSPRPWARGRPSASCCRSTSTHAGGGMKKRIGIVEDTGDNRRIIRDLLTSSDSQPQTLRQARSKNQPPSCFVRCVGISAIRLWRRTGPATAAVMVALSDRPGM